ncbi:MAG: B12-binding domain-containing radical SAM protein, partial [Veillonella sp.]
MPEKRVKHDKTKTPLMSVETQRPMHQFDVVAFDVTFEMDYFIFLYVASWSCTNYGKTVRSSILSLLPVACATFNPEPFADFIDAFIIGGGRYVSRVLDIIRDGKLEGLDRCAILRQLANEPGVYVPSLYVPIYSDDGEFKGYHIAEGAPKTIKRHFEMLTSGGETVVATNYTEFGAMYIIEVARGCGRHCRFCMAGYCFRVPRVRPLEILKEGVDRAEKLGKKIGLMGAAISDYPEVDELVNYIRS